MPRPRSLFVLALAFAFASVACGGSLVKPKHEYEEELYLQLDGTASLNLYASVPAIVALRGAELPVDPHARLDRDRVRALFEQPGADVSVSLSRRDGRRFVSVRVDVDDVRTLDRIAPLAWSTYRFQQRDDVLEYRQVVGDAAGRQVGDVGWDGTELVAFRMHVPSEILFHNSNDDIQRGNILEWDQPLAARLKGEPLELHVQMATRSILSSTLLLFASSIAAAAATFGLVLWWIARRGREADMAESHP